MIYSVKTREFNIGYTESEINKPILWESHCHAQFEMIAVAEGDVSVTAATGMMQGVVGLILTLILNWLCKKLFGESLY